MLFPTITFAVFFLVVYALNWLLMPRFRLWKWFIIAAGYVFYGWWDWRFVLLLVFATVVNQALAVQIWRARGRRSGARAAKGWLTLAVIVNLGLLGYFKYVDFFAVNLDHLLSSIGLGAPLPVLRVLLPVGISFLVFRVLTYTIDIYRGQLAPASTLDFGVYVAFFPYLLAGPIARARDFLPQLASPRNPHTVDAGTRLHPHPRRPRQEAVDRRLPLHAHRQRRLPVAAVVLGLGDRLGDRGLLGADLLRLQRVQRHRHRHLAAARVRAAGELQRPVHVPDDPGLLAPLAHHPLELAARLPVHPAGREPQGRPAAPT